MMLRNKTAVDSVDDMAARPVETKPTVNKIFSTKKDMKTQIVRKFKSC